MAVWRGRHVPDLIELIGEEVTDYWREVAMAGRALYAVFDPAQINYLTYGNSVPHLRDAFRGSAAARNPVSTVARSILGVLVKSAPVGAIRGCSSTPISR